MTEKEHVLYKNYDCSFYYHIHYLTVSYNKLELG